MYLNFTISRETESKALNFPELAFFQEIEFLQTLKTYEKNTNFHCWVMRTKTSLSNQSPKIPEREREIDPKWTFPNKGTHDQKETKEKNTLLDLREVFEGSNWSFGVADVGVSLQ